MTTSITIILNNNDLINHIYSFLSSVDDKTVIACINKTLYEVFRSKSYFTIQQDNLKQKMIKSYNYGLFLCVNAKCREEHFENMNNDYYDLDLGVDFSGKKIVGNIIFFYPNYLTEYAYIDDHISQTEYIIYRWYRHVQCKNGPKIKRFIPYCESCMHKYVNYGYRNDGNQVPYGYSYEYIKNI